jgi:hypothetical protein
MIIRSWLFFQINGRELHFSMVDGDFKKFEGKWSIRSGPRYASDDHFSFLRISGMGGKSMKT